MEQAWGFLEGAEAEVVVEGIVVAVGFVLSFAALLFPTVKPARLNSGIPRGVINAEGSLTDIATFTAKRCRWTAVPRGTTAYTVAFVLRTWKTTRQR